MAENRRLSLTLWFGKSERTDQEIWTQFEPRSARSHPGGTYDHWALDVEHPRLLVALVIMLDQFPRNMYRDTPQMYACDAHCLSLVKSGDSVAGGSGKPATDRTGFPLPGAHPLRGAERSAVVHGGMGPGDDRPGGGRSPERLSRDFPPARCGDQALRPVSPPPTKLLQRVSTGRGGGFPRE